MRLSVYDILVPMDVDKNSIHVAIFDRDRFLKRATFPYSPQRLLQFVRNGYVGKKCFFAYEAGPTGYGIYDYLKAEGEDCGVVVPSMIPKAPGQRVKTNRVDAVQLGNQMRGPDLKYVHVPEERYRDLRHLTRLRIYFMKRVAGNKNRLKALFLYEGIAFPKEGWSQLLLETLKKTTCRPAVLFKIHQIIEDLEHHHAHKVAVAAEIRKFCQADKELADCISYMESLDGIGETVAAYVLGQLGGWKHLTSVKKTCSLFGLGLIENSTGDRVRKGSITASGDPTGRKMIIQASWVAIRTDPELLAIYKNVCKNNPPQYAKQKAIVAVARHLIARLHAVLRDQRSFKLKRSEAQVETCPRIDSMAGQSEGINIPETRL